jgi:phosphoribosylformylglycinamidine synthase subunit PurS
MKVNVIVKPKEAVLDPQGAAVRDAMHHLGMPEVRSVRIGKYMEIELEGDGAELDTRLRKLCRDLLSNPVIEDYELRPVDAAAGSAAPPAPAARPARRKPKPKRHPK